MGAWKACLGASVLPAPRLPSSTALSTPAGFPKAKSHTRHSTTGSCQPLEQGGRVYGFTWILRFPPERGFQCSGKEQGVRNGPRLARPQGTDSADTGNIRGPRRLSHEHLHELASLFLSSAFSGACGAARLQVLAQVATP